jgi:hypothetical protein
LFLESHRYLTGRNSLSLVLCLWQSKSSKHDLDIPKFETKLAAAGVRMMAYVNMREKLSLSIWSNLIRKAPDFWEAMKGTGCSRQNSAIEASRTSLVWKSTQEEQASNHQTKTIYDNQ